MATQIKSVNGGTGVRMADGLDDEFKAYVQGLIDARCDKIMAGKFDE